MIGYVIYLSLWSYVAVGVYVALARFFSGRALVVRYVLLTALWLSAVLTGHAAFETRYIAAFGCVLLFAGIYIVRTRGRPSFCWLFRSRLILLSQPAQLFLLLRR